MPPLALMLPPPNSLNLTFAPPPPPPPPAPPTGTPRATGALGTGGLRAPPPPTKAAGGAGGAGGARADPPTGGLGAVGLGARAGAPGLGANTGGLGLSEGGPLPSPDPGREVGGDELAVLAAEDRREAAALAMAAPLNAPPFKTGGVEVPAGLGAAGGARRPGGGGGGAAGLASGMSSR